VSTEPSIGVHFIRRHSIADKSTCVRFLPQCRDLLPGGFLRNSISRLLGIYDQLQDDVVQLSRALLAVTPSSLLTNAKKGAPAMDRGSFLVWNSFNEK
jgi:hypothetical protein